MSRMTLSDRIAIEAGIYAKLSLKEIARKIRRSPRCVSEEIRRNSTIVAGFYAAGKNAIISAGTARNSTVRACAAHLQTGPVSDGAIHRMSATSAETAEYARWSGRTTSRSRQTPWQSGAMPKLEASRKQTLWSWKLWMHSFLR